MKLFSTWPSRFLLVFPVTVLILLGPLLWYQVRVDPLFTWSTPLEVGYNFYKPAQKTTERVFKPFQYRAMQPEAVMFGSSRVNYIMPATWPGVDDDKVFNYGINAAHIPEEAAFFHSALGTHEPRIISIGLDMLQFSAYLNKFQTGFSWQRLHMVRWSPVTAFLQNLADTVVSFDALSHSLETVKANGELKAEKHLFHRGWNTLGNKRHYRLGEYKRVLWKFSHGTYRKYQFSEANYALYQEMAEAAQQTDAELYIYINPIHCDFLATIYLTGKWEEFEDFKRRMVAVSPVWDFNYVNTVTRSRDNFIDPSHFLPRIGERMKRIMTGKEPPADFAFILDKENLEERLRQQRAAIEDWMKNHPRMTALLQRSIKTRDDAEFQRLAGNIIVHDL